jgi:hypothetical protein
MTTYQVDPARLYTLAVHLGELAQDLWWTADEARTRSWSVGPGQSQALLGEVLGDFEHQRLALGRALDELAAGARRAGTLYAEVDQAVVGSLGSG